MKTTKKDVPFWSLATVGEDISPSSSASKSNELHLANETDSAAVSTTKQEKT